MSAYTQSVESLRNNTINRARTLADNQGQPFCVIEILYGVTYITYDVIPAKSGEVIELSGEARIICTVYPVINIPIERSCLPEDNE